MIPVRISQSIIKEVEKNGCNLALKKYIERQPTKTSEAMLSGLYFEHYLIGATRDGELPEFKPLKSGAKPKAQLDLDDLIEKSKRIFTENNIIIEEQQPEYLHDDIVAHLDAVGTINGEKCIIDVKWTATRIDDKWIGWADPLNKEDAIIQAVHYVYTYLLCTGKKLPFYFLVFGKSGYVHSYRFEITDEKLERHAERINEVRKYLKEQIKNKFKHEAYHNDCITCRYKDNCKSFSFQLNTINNQIWV
tara:strand:+ start:497 stop:1240 length:744 start_codon:yes stop_codon:yes gene_type:complete